jgi:hypothetical protein
VAVLLDDGQLSATLVATTLAEIVDAWPAAGVIGVDMPLGLVERGWRQADRLAAARCSYGDLDVPVGLFAPAPGGGQDGRPATRSCPGASLWWQDRLGGSVAGRLGGADAGVDRE